MRCVSTSGAFPSSAASPLWGSYTPPPRCPFSSCSRGSRRPPGASSPEARAAPPRRHPPDTGRLLELHLHVLEMRLAILIDVEPVDLHGTVSACTGPSGRPSPAC